MASNGTPATGNVVLMIGTRKGGFVLQSDESRKNWSLAGPHSPGRDMYHMAYDGRDGGTLYMANNFTVWGPEIQVSRDMGATWDRPSKQPAFQSDSNRSVSKIWHVKPGRDAEPNVVYAGVAPGALFKSVDGGDTWAEVTGLSEHPTHEQWQPGLGGLCLHSIVLDPNNVDRMWVGISAVGVFGTVDGGQTWQPMNKGVRADFLPDKFPDFGQCPHKMLAHPAKPNTLIQQNHCGVFRTDTVAENWHDVTEGLPSRFGFVLGLHSQDPDTYYVLPEDSVLGEDVGGGLRVVTDAKFRVFRTRDAGESWQPLTKGLPQDNAYLHAMREGMATDNLDPCGIYVGTSTGQVFYSRDDGDSWELLIDYLPPINSVECAIVV